jgi:hypothetical protein
MSTKKRPLDKHWCQLCIPIEVRCRFVTTNFDLFFMLGMPKVIARTLLAEDWYIDPDVGIKLYEFERPSKDGRTRCCIS